MAPRNGGRPRRTATKWPTALRKSAAKFAALWQSSPSCKPSGRRPRVFGGPKYTVSPVYEGMFKEELDAAAARHPNVAYDPQLIDATLALLLKTDGEALVIPTLNRDGDLLSDMVLQMFGSIAGSESQVLAFDEQNHIKVVFTEAPHGTAPALQGKNIANPMAMILAGAAILSYLSTRWQTRHPAPSMNRCSKRCMPGR